ncbi:hypothetical protein MMC24_002324 [Lignoscripta atroalba]|nr:hypothetical protein [Lignoscripta atroalba]
MHALFDKSAANNRWSIGAHVLKTFSEYFGTKTEQLDVYCEGGRATFTSYTEKIMDGNEILKQPLQTSVSIDTLDFEEFAVEEKLHIGISVKDFKAIITHAETLKTTITALYSHPTRPLQLAYQGHGMQCEFTLMTIGDFRGGSITPAPSIIRDRPSRPSSMQDTTRASEQDHLRRDVEAMPPPTQPASRNIVREPATQRTARPSPPPPKASVDHESLFLPQEDEDERQWDERNFDNDEDVLGWDASGDNDSFAAGSFHTTVDHRLPARSIQSDSGLDANDRRIAPTQRISQIRGIFDD